MAIKTKATLVEWIKRKLGSPVINIEAEQEQLEDNVDEAIQYFTKYSGDTTYRNALILQLSGGVHDYTLAEGIESVLGCDMMSLADGINILFSPMNQMYQGGMFDFNSLSQGSLVSYEMGMDYLDMAKDMLQGEYFTRYNKYTRLLTLTPTPTENTLGVLEVFTMYDPGAGESTIYNEIWVKKYALALTKTTLGHIWGKYNGVPLPGGGTLNAERIMASGEKEIEKLEADLTKQEGEPLEFIVD